MQNGGAGVAADNGSSGGNKMGDRGDGGSEDRWAEMLWDGSAAMAAIKKGDRGDEGGEMGGDGVGWVGSDWSQWQNFASYKCTNPPTVFSSSSNV